MVTRQALTIRSATLMLSLSLLLFSVATVPAGAVIVDTGSLMGNVVGVMAGVPENPINTHAAELAAKEDELAAREAALNAQRAVGAGEFTLSERLGLVSFALSVLLLLLVLLNFYFDWRRNSTRSTPFSVNLRGH